MQSTWVPFPVNQVYSMGVKCRCSVEKPLLFLLEIEQHRMRLSRWSEQHQGLRWIVRYVQLCREALTTAQFLVCSGEEGCSSEDIHHQKETGSLPLLPFSSLTCTSFFLLLPTGPQSDCVSFICKSTTACLSSHLLEELPTSSWLPSS